MLNKTGQDRAKNWSERKVIRRITPKLTQIFRPWLLDPEYVEQLEGYSAKIIYEEDDTFFIEYWNNQDELVEDTLPKYTFTYHEQEPFVGMYFGIVCYKLFGEHGCVGGLACYRILEQSFGK